VSSTLDLATGVLARALGLLERYLQAGTGPKELAAALGWALPLGVDDIGISALDVSGVVDKLGSVNIAIAGNAGSIEIDTQYADLLGEVAKFLSQIDGFGATLSAPADFLAKTNIAAEFLPRLIDFLTMQLLVQYAPTLFAAGTALGIFDTHLHDRDSSIYQSRHVRCTVHWDRVPRVFNDVSGLLGDIYKWGTPNYDPSSLTMTLGSLLRVFSVDIAVRPLPRRAEELITGAAAPQADADPTTQVFNNFAKGLAASAIDVGVSLYGLRPTTPGGIDGGLGVTPFLNGTTDLTFPLSSRLSVEFDSTLDLQSGLAFVMRGDRLRPSRRI
jgi:hypothetical protein